MTANANKRRAAALLQLAEEANAKTAQPFAPRRWLPLAHRGRASLRERPSP